MKRKLLALAIALVMIIGLVPAGILSANAVIVLNSEYDVEFGAAQDLSSYTQSGSLFTVDSQDSTKATLNATAVGSAETENNSLTKKDIITDSNDVFISAEIQIDKMPVFDSGVVSKNAHTMTGLYIIANRPYVSNVPPSLGISIFRADEQGNLKFVLKTGSMTVSTVYSLGKTTKQSFTLMLAWAQDGYVDVYCDGNLIKSFTAENTAETGYAPYTVTANNSRNQMLRIGFNSYGSTADGVDGYNATATISNVKIGAKVPHAHSGGTASCTQQAICETCGQPYGETAHVGGTATCTAKAVCTACGEAYGKLKDHTPNAEGNCTVCGNATGYTAMSDLTAAYKAENAFTSDGYSVTVNAQSATALAANTTNRSNYAGVLKGVIGKNTEFFHISQTITINQMPVFDGPKAVNTYTSNGFYNNLRRDTETTTNDYVTYVIYPDAQGNLNLYVYRADGTWTKVDLNRQLGQSFRLTTIWHENNSVTFYCDGVSLGNYDNATNAGSARGEHASAFTMGYSTVGKDGQVNDAHTGPVNFTVSNISYSMGHVEVDDGDCTTDNDCSVCGQVVTTANATHTGGTATCEKKAECTVCGKEYGDLAAHKPGDNGDCITGFTCTVCGDPVAATGSHTPATDDGDCTTAVKCTVCGKETTAAKEAHTPAEDDGDCTTAIKCTVCGKETTAAKEAHTEKVVNAKPATETEKGYTGDKVCSVCGKEIAKGQEIPVLEPAPTEPAPTTPPATEPSTPDAPVVNPDTGDNGTAVYALLLAVSMMAMVALMIPDIRNKLIRK